MRGDIHRWLPQALPQARLVTSLMMEIHCSCLTPSTLSSALPCYQLQPSISYSQSVIAANNLHPSLSSRLAIHIFSPPLLCHQHNHPYLQSVITEIATNNLHPSLSSGKTIYILLTHSLQSSISHHSDCRQ